MQDVPGHPQRYLEPSVAALMHPSRLALITLFLLWFHRPSPLTSPPIYQNLLFDRLVGIPLLDRVRFLAQLATAGANSRRGKLEMWQALLNAVLASGCRATLSDETAKVFKESGRETWGFFQTVISYELRIVDGSTDLTAVQAMTVMTVFAQGLSSPQRLE